MIIVKINNLFPVQLFASLAVGVWSHVLFVLIVIKSCRATTIEWERFKVAVKERNRYFYPRCPPSPLCGLFRRFCPWTWAPSIRILRNSNSLHSSNAINVIVYNENTLPRLTIENVSIKITTIVIYDGFEGVQIDISTHQKSRS